MSCRPAEGDWALCTRAAAAAAEEEEDDDDEEEEEEEVENVEVGTWFLLVMTPRMPDSVRKMILGPSLSVTAEQQAFALLVIELSQQMLQDCCCCCCGSDC